MTEARGPGDTAIAWQESGEGDGLVLVHSLGTDSTMWSDVADRLSARYRTIRMDLRGHGKSAVPPGPYTIDGLGEDVLAVADSAGLDRFHLAGISIGGQMALWVAIHHPQRLQSVILSDTAARIGSRDGWQQRIEAVRGVGMAGIAPQVVGGWFSDGFAERHPDRWENALAMFGATDPEGYVGCCRALAEADLRDRVAAVSVPTMIVIGEADHSTPPSDAEDLHTRIRDSRLEVMGGCAHLPPLERPEEYASLLEEWLGGGR